MVVAGKVCTSDSVGGKLASQPDACLVCPPVHLPVKSLAVKRRHFLLGVGVGVVVGGQVKLSALKILTV